jgi:hypothetical protein
MRVTERLLAPAPEQTAARLITQTGSRSTTPLSESPSCFLSKATMRRWSPSRTKTGTGR